MASQVGEVCAVLVADGADRCGGLGHDCVDVVWKQVKGNSALVAHLVVNLLAIYGVSFKFKANGFYMANSL